MDSFLASDVWIPGLYRYRVGKKSGNGQISREIFLVIDYLVKSLALRNEDAQGF